MSFGSGRVRAGNAQMSFGIEPERTKIMDRAHENTTKSKSQRLKNENKLTNQNCSNCSRTQTRMIASTSKGNTVKLGCVLRLLAVTLTLVSHEGLCFNVDTRTAVIHSGPTGSMFGFSVAQQLQDNKNWLLVGAPKAPTSQNRIIEGGAVYKCPVRGNAECVQEIFDTKGNNIKWNGSSFVQVEDKSYQWFGATVRSTGPEGLVVACAPRYVYFTREYDRREPVGNCFVKGGPQKASRAYSPCKLGVDSDTLLVPKKTAYNFGRGHCQAGWATSLSSDGQTLFMGAPGSYYWQGQVFSQDLTNFDDYYETSEAPASHDDTYMGYAMGTGDFNGDGIPDIAVGIPKAAGMRGKVAVLDDELRSLYNVSGDQLGEYFGSSVAVGDFNGDGMDDIAVGAPFYTDNYADAFENGRVYVFYQDRRNSLLDSITHLKGQTRLRSRFGFAVSSLKDINDDYYDDLAVGAPYDGEDGMGAVYIFHGSSSGILPTVSQVIQPKHFNSAFTTFGYSLSSGLDQDGNVYPDILVGAYESNKAVFLRSRPIVRVDISLKMDPAIIDIDKKNCELMDKTKVSCFSVVTCVSYSGLKTPGKIKLSLRWELAAFEKISPRSFFLSGNEKGTKQESSIVLTKNIKSCSTSTAYIKENLKDKLTPITAKFTHNLTNPTNPASDELLPILDQYQSKVDLAQLNILKNCGHDNICIPDLVVQSQSMTKQHVLGTEAEVDVMVQVANLGEDSYESQVRIAMPSGVSYINVHKVESTLPVKCVSYDTDKENIVLCDIGNPLPSGSLVLFTIRTFATSVNGSADFLRFSLKANSTNPENYTDLGDNVAFVSIPVIAVTDIRLTGVSKPEQVLFNSTDADNRLLHEQDIGPEVIHLYEVRNLGPSDIGSLSVIVHWPTFLDGADLLYLPLVPQVIRGTGHCVAQHVNRLNLTVEERDFDLSVYEALKGKQKRSKRDMQEASLLNLHCAPGVEECDLIRCEIGRMRRGDSVLIQIHARVFVETVVNLQSAGFRALIISSEAVAQVMEVPYAVTAEDYSIDTYKIETYIGRLDMGVESQGLKLWIIIVSIIGGCILLLLLILLMYKCGFFHRLRPEDHEKEKLTNGTTEVQTYTATKSGPHKYDGIPNDQL